MKKLIGIYKITCIVNGKMRIGHGSDIKKRWSQYKAELRKNKSTYADMQSDWNDYGEENFKFEVLEECPKYQFKERENYYILKFNAINNGYNTSLNNEENKGKIRRGKESANYYEKRSQITSGENNGHCIKLCKDDVFEIFDMLADGISKDFIAGKFDISKSYVSLLGKYRWKKAFQEWKKEKEAESIGVDTTSSAVAQ